MLDHLLHGINHSEYPELLAAAYVHLMDELARLPKTLSQVFSHMDVRLEEPPQAPVRLTYVVSASDRRSWPETVSAVRGLPRQWFSITEPIALPAPHKASCPGPPTT